MRFFFQFNNRKNFKCIVYSWKLGRHYYKVASENVKELM